MTIIKTRYRDIPLQELRDSHPAHYQSFPPDLWLELRGTPLQISGKPTFNDYGCGGPWYDVIGDNKQIVVCPHIAEIGD